MMVKILQKSAQAAFVASLMIVMTVGTKAIATTVSPNQIDADFAEKRRQISQ
ncbi:hypothetical protein [Moraxella cuniculi]|uniref:hypothetical protein n=1 Tax=Moraxella cuniculi TaxID=34061 RepID=UPI0013011054|nr:hypothetical protein [Moraxella cuniculi]